MVMGKTDFEVFGIWRQNKLFPSWLTIGISKIWDTFWYFFS
jgi:hypothetical protein